MNLLKKTIFIMIVVFVGIQFIPTTLNQNDEVLESDITKAYMVPNNIQTILKESCYDCHSNNTHYPWYNKVQPVSLFLENHIQEGKAALNFSDFGSYSSRKQKKKFKSIGNQIEDNEMPLFSYKLIHRKAALSEIEKRDLLSWLEEVQQ